VIIACLDRSDQLNASLMEGSNTVMF